METTSMLHTNSAFVDCVRQLESAARSVFKIPLEAFMVRRSLLVVALSAASLFTLSGPSHGRVAEGTTASSSREASRERPAREAPSREASRERSAREAPGREASRERTAREAAAKEVSRERPSREVARSTGTKEAPARSAPAKEVSVKELAPKVVTAKLTSNAPPRTHARSPSVSRLRGIALKCATRRMTVRSAPTLAIASRSARTTAMALPR